MDALTGAWVYPSSRGIIVASCFYSRGSVASGAVRNTAFYSNKIFLSSAALLSGP